MSFNFFKFKGIAKKKMTTFMYTLDYQNDARDEGTILDEWVVDNLKEYFKEAKANPVLREKMNKQGVVMFCHLLGIDTNGHHYKPHSQYVYSYDQLIHFIICNISYEIIKFDLVLTNFP